MSDRVKEEVYFGNDGVEHSWSTVLRRDWNGKYEVVLRGNLPGVGWQSLVLLTHSHATREDALEDAAYNTDLFRMDLMRIADAMKDKAREARPKRSGIKGFEGYDRKKKVPGPEGYDKKKKAAEEGAETKRWGYGDDD